MRHYIFYAFFITSIFGPKIFLMRLLLLFTILIAFCQKAISLNELLCSFGACITKKARLVTLLIT